MSRVERDFAAAAAAALVVSPFTAFHALVIPAATAAGADTRATSVWKAFAARQQSKRMDSSVGRSVGRSAERSAVAGLRFLALASSFGHFRACVCSRRSYLDR